MRRLVLAAVAVAGLAVALPAATAGDIIETERGSSSSPVTVNHKHVCVGTSPEKRGGDVDAYCVSIDLPLKPLHP